MKLLKGKPGKQPPRHNKKRCVVTLESVLIVLFLSLMLIAFAFNFMITTRSTLNDNKDNKPVHVLNDQKKDFLRTAEITAATSPVKSIATAPVIESETTTVTVTVTEIDPEATHCTDLLQSFRNNMIDEAKTKGDKNYQRAFVAISKTPKPFYVSTHDKIIDSTRSTTFKKQNYYENQLTLRVAEIFDIKSANGEESIMLDVGANIGWFSLVAIAHGATTVYSFEPNVQNMIRYCESLQMNGWLHDDRREDIVFPIMKGASDENAHLRLYTPDLDNPGSFSFSKESVKRFRVSNRPKLGQLEVTTLDSFAERHGWFESKPTIALFKLDVELYEDKVLAGAARLIKSNIIEKIAMEIRPKQKVEKVNAVVKMLVETGYELYLYGGYTGPRHPVTKIYNNDWEDLVTDILNDVYHENVMFRLRKDA